MKVVIDVYSTKYLYTNIQQNVNGREAWEKLNKYKAEGTIEKNVRLVITDIEMPLMDGHRLLKLIREDNDLKELPVIIFSSLLNDDMRKKGEALGANAQLSKPEIGDLVGEIDKILR